MGGGRRKGGAGMGEEGEESERIHKGLAVLVNSPPEPSAEGWISHTSGAGVRGMKGEVTCLL